MNQVVNSLVRFDIHHFRKHQLANPLLFVRVKLGFKLFRAKSISTLGLTRNGRQKICTNKFIKSLRWQRICTANANVPLSLKIFLPKVTTYGLRTCFSMYIMWNCNTVSELICIFSTTATKKVEDDGVRIETRANIIDFLAGRCCCFALFFLYAVVAVSCLASTETVIYHCDVYIGSRHRDTHANNPWKG